MAADPQESELYALLMSLKPADLTPNAWAGAAGVSRTFFSDLKRGAQPRVDTLEKVLRAISFSMSEFDLIRSGATIDEVRKRPDPIAPFRAPPSGQRLSNPRDLPVLGSAMGGDMQVSDNGDRYFAEMIELDLNEVVDHIRRPATLSLRRDVYALYTVGVSMEPRYRQGSILIIDPGKPPRVGDDVVVQLRRAPDDGDDQVYCALIKTLARLGSDYVELEQYNPPFRFRLDRKEIARMHRVMTLDELVGA